MNVSYVEKQPTPVRSLGTDPNGWPSEGDTIWRVVENGSSNEAFLQGDLLLNLCSRYSGYAIINLRSKTIHVGKIDGGYQIKVIQDFTINTVTLYVDNSARP